jgi:hypothetical protein
MSSPLPRTRRSTRLIPDADGRSADGEAGHYAFLADNPDFAEVRQRVAVDAVAFFQRHLVG